MKRLIIALLFLAAVTAAYVGGNSGAQSPAPAQVAKFTKVGVVNFGTVFTKYDKVKAFKEEMEKEAEPFKVKKKEIDDTIKEWTEILKDPAGKLKEKNRLKGQQILLDSKRALEDLDIEFKRDFGQRLEKEMTQLWQEINGKVKELAKRQGYQLILAYGEPEVELTTLVEFKRKMAVIDSGGLVLAYGSGTIDVTADLVKTLNSSYRTSQPVKSNPPR